MYGRTVVHVDSELTIIRTFLVFVLVVINPTLKQQRKVIRICRMIVTTENDTIHPQVILVFRTMSGVTGKSLSLYSVLDLSSIMSFASLGTESSVPKAIELDTRAHTENTCRERAHTARLTADGYGCSDCRLLVTHLSTIHPIALVRMSPENTYKLMGFC